ncbi:MAG TPA: AMP-binding protein [Streptosporangiaceae bacterium]|jgi:acyl-CoA synthetase (AMP-forming)/AMP-acid ligase II|nr:AMP-binding protein [Streptosporangiaceae bacterium]
MTEPGGANYVLRALDLFADYGDTEAIVYAGQRVSYASLASTTLDLASALTERDVRPGSRVAILVPDQPETAALQLALHLLGCQTAWIASYAPRRDQAEFIGLSGADLLIYHPAMIRRADFLADLTRSGGLRVLSVGADGELGELAATPGAASLSPAEIAAAGPEPESLFYTGGTTGTPKLVQHRQDFYQNLLDIAEYYLSIDELPMRFLSGSSFSHVSGQLAGFLTLFEGGTLFQMDDFTPAGFLATIERERISSAFLTPALLYEVIDQPSAADTSSLRYLNVGGAAASPDRLARAIARFGPVLRLVYGSSEAPLITDFPFLDHDEERPERLRSCGLPFLDTNIEIRDNEGAVQPVGEAGEVWVAGSLVMSGYATGSSAPADGESAGNTGDGWVSTGDIGYLDEDGYLYLVDRVSDMIVTSEAAANVYCRPIEDALQGHPEVRAAAVVGVPDESFGESVCAFVVPVPGGAITASDLRDHVRAQLNSLYTPRFIEFVDELPLTELAKVDKRALRQAYKPSGR